MRKGDILFLRRNRRELSVTLSDIENILSHSFCLVLIFKTRLFTIFLEIVFYRMS